MQAEAVDYIKFTLISPEEIKKISVAKITVPDTYNEEGYPIDGGLIDQRLGVIDPGLKCKTCGGKAKTCPGHFGHIELVRPVIHPEFAKVIYMLLRSTCSSCHKLLLTPEKINDIREDINNFAKAEDEDDEEATLMLAEDDRNALIKQLRTIKKCPHCGAVQQKIKFERPTFFYVGGNRIKPDEIRDWLSKISDDDLKLIGIDPEATRPEWFILTTLLVPPVNVRPSITLESGERSEDDLTHKLVDVIRSNQRLEQDIDAGAPQIIIDDLWELLQYQVTTYFNNETPGVPVARHRTTKPLKTLAQRLKGKEGRLRYNLSGKRVNFAARTVISCDPTLTLNEIGIPERIAETLTVPVYVTLWNIEECKKMIRDKSRPVVNLIMPNGLRKHIIDMNIEEIVNELKPGMILERKLKDGDNVLFNRQPTLHRVSIMSHKAKIIKGKTLRLANVATVPYNADFDGDEMNLHVPQSLEAQAEERYLMQAKDQILSPRDGKPLMALSEEELIGAYWLTKDDTYFEKDEAMNMLASIGIYELPKESKNGKYSGKSIISMLLPKDIDLEIKGIFDTIVIKKGVLEKGTLDVKTVGRSGSLLFLEIYKKHGADVTADIINKISLLSVYVGTYMGMTLSISDYYPSDEMLKTREKIIKEVFEKTDKLLEAYKNKTLTPLLNYTRKETYEMLVFAQLNEARIMLEEPIKKYYSMENEAYLIPTVHARGSISNLVQIVMALGQQSVRGERPSRGYNNRVLTYIKKGDKSPQARGFVKSSFFEGMNPIELYMHAMGGRDSTMGKSLLTAISGYLQRRVIHALQDLYVDDDLSVKDASGALIETIYGGDGIDPTKVRLVEEKN
ncbi:MAG: DNA-directed RNA polymerase subunit A' [Candidatus Micrarchaeia archaeon]